MATSALNVGGNIGGSISKEKGERKNEKSQPVQDVWFKEKHNQARHQSIYQLVEYQSWLAERHERSNETLSMRATSILGFRDLAAAIFAVVSPKLFTHEFVIAVIGGITAVLFLIAIGLLLLAPRDKEFHWPSFDFARELIYKDFENQTDFLSQAIYSSRDSSCNIFLS